MDGPQWLTLKHCLLKFIYSEKATKFCEIFTFLLTVCTVVKSKVKISQNFVAFSKYMNFNIGRKQAVILSLHIPTYFFSGKKHRYISDWKDVSGSFCCKIILFSKSTPFHGQYPGVFPLGFFFKLAVRLPHERSF